MGLVDAEQMAEFQLTELRNMRVLLEETRVLARNLAYHRRAKVQAVIGQALDEADRQIEDLRRDRAWDCMRSESVSVRRAGAQPFTLDVMRVHPG